MRGLGSSGRPTVAEIDLKALEFNYRQIQKKIPRGTKILGVVKADAYGHGSLRVSLTLEALGVEYLGVAIPDEGIELREGGVRAPILILGGLFSEEQGSRFMRYDLTPVVFEKESLRYFSREAKKKRKRIKVHLKVDTGMGRLGVPMEDWLWRRIQGFLPGIFIWPTARTWPLLRSVPEVLCDRGSCFTGRIRLRRLRNGSICALS
jgi:alanine racemase